MSTTIGCKDVGIRKFEFVAKTLFPYVKIIKFKKSFSFKHNSFKETFTLRDENIIIDACSNTTCKKTCNCVYNYVYNVFN